MHSIHLNLCNPLVSSTLVWQVILALEWKHASRDYHDVLTSAFDHPSYLQLQTNKQVKHPNTFLFVRDDIRSTSDVGMAVTADELLRVIAGNQLFLLRAAVTAKPGDKK